MKISPLAHSDHHDWLPLWQGYLTFYESTLPNEVTETTFERLTQGEGMYGAIARDDHGRAVGFVNWLTHASTWNPSVVRSTTASRSTRGSCTTRSRSAGTDVAAVNFASD